MPRNWQLGGGSRELTFVPLWPFQPRNERAVFLFPVALSRSKRPAKNFFRGIIGVNGGIHFGYIGDSKRIRNSFSYRRVRADCLPLKGSLLKAFRVSGHRELQVGTGIAPGALYQGTRLFQKVYDRAPAAGFAVGRIRRWSTRKQAVPRKKAKTNCMDAKIVVALAQHEDVEEVISCFDFLIRPGMTVVVLVPYPLELLPYIRDHWVTTESVRAATELGREIIARYSWERQQELAERKFAAAREALGMKGVEVVVNFYTGSLKEALLKYSADPKVFWIVRPAPTGRLFGRLLERIVAPFRSTKLAPSWSLFRIAHRRGACRRTG
jgi:hypothetical protein